MAALFNDSSEPVPVEAISGACFMIRRELFSRVQGFDERYFMYSEDIDLSHKVWQAGFKCFYVPGTTVIHHGGGSSRQARSAFSNVMIRESVYRFLRQHRGGWTAGCFRFCIGLSALFRLPLAAGLWLLRRGTAAENAFRKWTSILRWSIGLESWSGKQ
jgi:hypothetical protein